MSKHKRLVKLNELTCVNCVYEPNKDLGKYVAIYKHGRLRIRLDPITHTLFICPKCKSQHISPEFKVEDMKGDVRRLRQKHAQRVQMLKALYH
jgi:hypothetical protein